MPLPDDPEAWMQLRLEPWARLGRRIRAERERRGLSRKELADLADVSVGSVQSAEAGRPPKKRWPQTLSAIERALEWAPDSMKRVLYGEEPEVLSLDNSTPATAGAPDLDQLDFGFGREEPAPNRPVGSRAGSYRELPMDVREVLPVIYRFSRLCGEYGASRGARAMFDRALLELLIDLQVAGDQQPLPGLGVHRKDDPASQTLAQHAAALARQGPYSINEISKRNGDAQRTQRVAPEDSYTALRDIVNLGHPASMELLLAEGARRLAEETEALRDAVRKASRPLEEVIGSRAYAMLKRYLPPEQWRDLSGDEDAADIGSSDDSE